MHVCALVELKLKYELAAKTISAVFLGGFNEKYKLRTHIPILTHDQ